MRSVRENSVGPNIFRKSIVSLLVVLHCSALSAVSQDQSNFTNFYLNPYLLNSSYAGMDGQPSASFLYRKQWMTIDGAPTITNVSLHAPLSSRVSAGVNINNDSKGFFNNSTLLFSVAYHVPVLQHSFIRFGMSAGGSWNTVDMKKLENVNDPALSSVLDKNSSLAGNAGVSFHHKTFNGGIAMPTLFSSSFVSEDAFNVTEVKPFQALVIHATNRFYFNNDKNIFEPYILYHISQALPAQFELVGIVHLNHVLWAGASYKQDYGISALGGVKLKNALAIGASYSIQQSGMDELNSPSFEVSLNYLFGNHKRNAPVYSFVNAIKGKEQGTKGAVAHATAARQKQVEAEQKRRAEAARVRAEQDENRKRVAQKNALKKKEAEEQRKLAEEKMKADESARQQKVAKTEELQVTSQTQPHTPAITQPIAVEKAAPPLLVVPEPNVEPSSLVEEKDEPVAEQVLSGGQQPVNTPQNVPEGHPQHDEEQLKRLEADAVDPTRTIEEGTSNPVRHEIVKRGNHPDELAASEYVIVGVFKSLANAKHFSDGLRSLNFNTRHGYLTPKDLWYVYTLKTNDMEKARAEQARISKLFLLRDAWLLTVEP